MSAQQPSPPVSAPGFRRAFLINLASSTGATLTRFVVFVALARLLAPAEFGAFGIALAIVNVAQVLGDCGVSTWLQREAELTPAKLRAAFGFLAASGLALAATLGLGADAIAAGLGQPAVAAPLGLLALGFLLLPFNALVAALQQRALAAARLALAARVGTLAYAAAAIALAALGVGTTSLAWAQLANLAACALVYLPLRPAGLGVATAGWGAMLRFGAATLPARLLATTNAAVPELLLGRLGAVAQVGLLGRAQSVVGLFGTLAGAAIDFGAQPRLAADHHAGRPLAPWLVHAIALLTGVGWPALAVTAVLGHELVLLLFGPAWLEAVPAVAPLALIGALAMPFHYDAAACAACGRPAFAAGPVAATVTFRIALVPLLYDGTVAGFAFVMLGAAAISLPLQLWLNARIFALPPRTLAVAVAPSAAAAAVAGFAAFATRQVLPQDLTPMAVLAVCIPVAALAGGAALRATAHPLAGELQRAIAGALRLRSTIRK